MDHASLRRTGHTLRGGGLSAFAQGLVWPLRGARYLLGHRTLWPLALVPALVAVVLLLVGGSVALLLVDDLQRALTPEWAAAVPGEAIANAGRWTVRALLAGASFAIAAAGTLVSVFALTLALSGTFQELLSEAVEKQLRGEGDPPFDLVQTLKDVARGLVSTLLVLGVYLLVYVPLLLGSMLPVVGALFVAMTAIYSAYFLGYGALDPTLERRKLGFFAKQRFIGRHLAAHLGFGAGLLALSLIPGVALVITPALVVGGALFVLAVEPDPAADPDSCEAPAPSAAQDATTTEATAEQNAAAEHDTSSADTAVAQDAGEEAGPAS